jgi:hypothetical protein
MKKLVEKAIKKSRLVILAKGGAHESKKDKAKRPHRKHKHKQRLY